MKIEETRKERLRTSETFRDLAGKIQEIEVRVMRMKRKREETKRKIKEEREGIT
jgi:hypothetical protein